MRSECLFSERGKESVRACEMVAMLQREILEGELVRPLMGMAEEGEKGWEVRSVTVG